MLNNTGRLSQDECSEVAFVCIDIETTGLDYENDCILEVAIVLADEDLNEIRSNSWLVYPETDLAEMDEFVSNMHKTSGLLADIEWVEWVSSLGDNRPEYPSRHSYQAVDENIVSWLSCVLLLPSEKFPMFGSSVGFDRRMLSKWMPRLESWFHYRNIDISTVKELAKVWRPELKWAPTKDKAHRGYDDCLSTLEEARFYKDLIFPLRYAFPSELDLPSLSEVDTLRRMP